MSFTLHACINEGMSLTAGFGDVIFTTYDMAFSCSTCRLMRSSPVGHPEFSSEGERDAWGHESFYFALKPIASIGTCSQLQRDCNLDGLPTNLRFKLHQVV